MVHLAATKCTAHSKEARNVAHAPLPSAGIVRGDQGVNTFSPRMAPPYKVKRISHRLANRLPKPR